MRERSARELASEADSTQHEGVLLHVRERSWLPPRDLAAALLPQRSLAVALDRVRNPQNIGAVLRSAAFRRLTQADEALKAQATEAEARIRAEGRRAEETAATIGALERELKAELDALGRVVG